MRYLAEVQKQSKGFMGGIETKLKLLANQRNDRSWSTISGNEFVAIEDVGNLGDGALVIVNIDKRQVKGKLEPASKEIIGLLQGFSRLMEKTKSQEEEIEVWKESLTIQSEELSKREIDIEARLEKIEQIEEEKEDIIKAKEEAETIRSEFQVKSQELNKAWEQLRGEKNYLEQQIKENRVLDEESIGKLQKLLDRLSSEPNSSDNVREKLNLIFSSIENKQDCLDKHWQALEKYNKEIEQAESKSNQYSLNLNELNIQVSLIQESLDKINSEKNTVRESLNGKKELLDFLKRQDNSYSEINESFARLGIESSDSDSSKRVDLNELENMPLPELEIIVSNLQKDLEKVSRFVHEQEEELNWQCQAVKELETKILEASEFDRLALEQELSEEKEAEKMLYETLVGQRRSLKERHEVLLQHSRILKRRQGIFDLEAELESINLEPIKQHLQQQQLDLKKRQEEIILEIESLEKSISNLEGKVKEKIVELNKLDGEVTKKEQDYFEIKIYLSKLQFQILFYQENLQPLQDNLNTIRTSSEEIESLLTKDSGMEDTNVLSDIDAIVQKLIDSSTVAVS